MTPELGGQFQGIKSCSEWMFRVLSPAGIWRNPPLPSRGQSQQAFALPAVGRLKHPGGQPYTDYDTANHSLANASAGE
jgi:hypothetical protein